VALWPVETLRRTRVQIPATEGFRPLSLTHAHKHRHRHSDRHELAHPRESAHTTFSILMLRNHVRIPKNIRSEKLFVAVNVLRRWGLVAVVVAVVIVTSAFSSVSVRATPVNESTADPGTILGMSGTVNIETNGSNEWRPLVPSDVIRSGDNIMTGSDGQLLVGFGGTDKVRLGENTNVTTSDPNFAVESNSTASGVDPPVLGCKIPLLHLGFHLGCVQLVIGELWALLEATVGGSDGYDAQIGGNTAVGIRGTEFAATAYENGTTNVMVLDGLVEVQDLTRNSTVLLQANQTITMPSVSGGLSEQDMLQRVATVNPNSIDRWWETPITTPSSTLALLQPVYVVGVVVVAVVIAGTLILYVRRRKGKA
jgi:hypothetical protein